MVRLYKRIYGLRNTGLHGNPMPRRRLNQYPPVAVLLFRGLLLRLLCDKLDHVLPSLDFENCDVDAYMVHSHNRDLDDVLLKGGLEIA